MYLQMLECTVGHPVLCFISQILRGFNLKSESSRAHFLNFEPLNAQKPRKAKVYRSKQSGNNLSESLKRSCTIEIAKIDAKPTETPASKSRETA